MLTTCPDCQKQISDIASVCPNCGRLMSSASGAGKTKWVIGLLVAVILLAGVGFMVFNLPEKGEVNLVPVRMGDKEWVYINTQGEMVIAAKYEAAEGFAVNGLARVKEDGKWGYINTEGEMVIPPRFKEASDFAGNGLAAVINENRFWSYINAQGEMVIPARFQSAGGFAANGLARVRENGKWGYINGKGETVVSIDRLCNAEVLKNDANNIIWPQKSTALICEEQAAKESQAREEAERRRILQQEEFKERAAQECAHVYVDKVFKIDMGLLSDRFTVMEFSSERQRVTVKSQTSGATHEIPCRAVPK